MSFPDPSNGSTTSSPLQRLVIAIGTLIVVALTVIAAILLAVRNPTSPPITSVSTVTGVAVLATLTPTPVTSTPLPAQLTATPSATPTPSPSPLPTEEPTNTPLPPPPTETPTDTPVPPPAFTPTPIIVVVTPTPLPDTPLPPAPPPGSTVGVCQAPPTWIAYTAQTGDTLDSLAIRTNTSVYELQQVNCLQSFTIQPGQIIYLPFNPPTPTITSTSTPITPSPTPSRTGTPTATPRPPEIFRADVSVDREILSVVGRNFKPDEPGFQIELRGATGVVPLALGRLKTSTSFEAELPPPADLPGGDYDLRVINPDNQFDIARITIPP